MGNISVNESAYGKSEYIDYMLYLFTELSSNQFPSDIEVPNKAWFDYIDLVYKGAKQPAPTKIVTDCLPKIHIDNPTDGIMVGFSGGSDSTTTAAYLNDREDISEVVLFNMRGLNRVSLSEKKSASNVANHLGLELLYHDIKYTGKFDFVESPVKNHLVMMSMIPEMEARKIVKCSEGLFIQDTLDNIGGLYGVSDAYDVCKAFEKAVQETFPQFRYVTCFKNWTHEFAYLVKYHSDLIPLYQSCMTPDRFRGHLKEKNEQKFGISILDNRCLSCWKCCKEYIMLGMFKYHKVVPKVYNHCLQTLRKYYARECGITEAQAKSISSEVILSKFMFLEDIMHYVNDMSLVDKDFDFVKPYNE